MELQAFFAPNLTASYRWMSLCLVLGLAGLTVAVLSFRRKDFPVRQASQLVGPLVALVGLAGAGMILWDIARTPTVITTQHFVLLGNDTLHAVDIERAYIEAVVKSDAAGKSKPRDLGIVQSSKGQTWMFAQDNYDVKAVIQAIREVQRSASQ